MAIVCYPPPSPPSRQTDTMVVDSPSNQRVNEDELNEFDVLCGRDKRAFNHPGNRRLRVAVSLQQERYASATGRKDKSVIIKSVMMVVRKNGGRFLRCDQQQGVLEELSEKESHEKVGHAFRDMVLANKKIAQGSKSSKPVQQQHNQQQRQRQQQQRKKATRSTPIPPTQLLESFRQRSASANLATTAPTTTTTTISSNTTFPQQQQTTQSFSLTLQNMNNTSSTSVTPTDSNNEPEPLQFDASYFRLDGNNNSNIEVAPVTPRQQQQQLFSDPFDIFDEVSVSDVAHVLDPTQQQATAVVEASNHDDRRGSVDDNMLQWLVGESDNLLFD